MRISLKIILLLVVMFSCLECKKTETTDVVSNVKLSVVLPDEIKADKLQLVIECRNLNTGQIFSNQNIDKSDFDMQLLKGIYIILVTGKVVYYKDNVRQLKEVRGYVEDVEFLERNTNYSIKMIFM